jgi:tRNA A-37 threonylcarbamoyl transferase component Bud32/tetratricopeptide (TPR) repeat protein
VKIKSSEQWQRIDSVFGHALPLPESARSAYLDESCSTDPELRAQVERLLAASDSAGGFLESLDTGRAGRLLESSTETGGTIGRYKVIRKIGSGGMGVVYLAEDASLKRQVAVKVLAPWLDASSAANRRLVDEARAASAIDHPNIATVHEIGETEDGRLFITMSYYEGDTLRDRMARGHLSMAEAADIAMQTARGLSAAHERGIIHRDIKPENILLRPDGTVKIVDFGIAEMEEQQALTQTTTAVGTAAYMSPEQTFASSVDSRTDLWSLGVVLYEMLAQERPFRGGTRDEIIVSIQSEPLRMNRQIEQHAPASLRAIVERCLQKEPAARYQSADELLRDLESVVVQVSRSGRRSIVAIVAVAIVLVVGGIAVALRAPGIWPVAPFLAAGAPQRPERILVGDFRVTRGDTTLGSVVTEAFRISLAQSRNIAVMTPTSMQDALRRMARDASTPVEGAVAREIATRDGIKGFVDGEILSMGGRFVISARLTETSSGETLATLQEQADNERGVLPAVDQLTRDLRRRAGDSFAQIRAALPLEQVTTPSLEALRAYVQGVNALNSSGDFDKGRRLLEHAIALDTAFAMAYRKLGIEMSNRNMDPARSMEYLGIAYRHRDRLTEAERYLCIGTYFERGPEADNEKAIQAYETLVEMQPTNVNALHNAANRLGWAHRYEQARKYWVRAIQLPDVIIQAIGGYGGIALYFGDTAEVRRAIGMSERRVGRNPYGHVRRLWLLAGLGQADSAVKLARGLADSDADAGNKTAAMRLVAGIVGTRGHVREAGDALRRAATFRGEIDSIPLLPAIDSAWVDVALRGDTARGRRRLDRALAGHPLASVPHLQRPYAPLGRLLADVGRLDALKQLAAFFERDSKAVRTIADERIRHGLAGDIALAEHRYIDAAHEYHLASVAASTCIVCVWPLEAHAFDLAGKSDSAIAVFTRFLEQPDVWRTGDAFQVSHMVDATWLAATYMRLGELWQARGDHAKAAKYYAAFVDLWQGADPELQPRVASARRKLAAVREP